MGRFTKFIQYLFAPFRFHYHGHRSSHPIKYEICENEEDPECEHEREIMRQKLEEDDLQHRKEIEKQLEVVHEELPKALHKLHCTLAEGYPLSFAHKLHHLPKSFVHPAPYQLKQILIKSALIIYNPFSGAKCGTKIARKVAQILSEGHRIRVLLQDTRKRGHAEEICQVFIIILHEMISSLVLFMVIVSPDMGFD